MSGKAKAGPVKLGINPISWSNDDLPELGGDIPLERCLRETRMAGFSGIEKGGKFPGDPKLLRPIMAEHGLDLISGWYSGRLLDQTVEQEQQQIASHLNLLLAMGSPVLVYAETTGTVQGQMDTPVADRPVLPRDSLRRYGEKLTRFADWLKREGCTMAFHHHMGTVIETESEIDLLMENSDVSVGLLFDSGHLTFAGGDTEAVIRRWAQRINHVHAKNIRAPVLERLKAERWSFLKGVLNGVYTVPGDPEGCIDFRAIAQHLAAIGYQGWIVIEAEQDPAKAEPLRYATMGREEIQAACEAAGITVTPQAA